MIIRTLVIASALAFALPAHAHNHADDAQKSHDGHDMKKHDGDHDHEPVDAKTGDGKTGDDKSGAARRAGLEAAVAAGGELVVADVLGVVCDFCATAMDKTFSKRAEVAATYVDLDDKTLSIVLKPGAALDDETIGKLVKKSGYKLAAVRRGDDARAVATEGADAGHDMHDDHGAH